MSEHPKMRAAVIQAANTAPVIKLVDPPVPGAGDVLVTVSSAALNPP
jgi:NADPH:quinone reductase-like Zn-dependent oxidoreductase